MERSKEEENKIFHQKFRLLMKEKGWNLIDIARITGRSHDSVRSSLRLSGDFPVWLKIAVEIWDDKKNDKKV